MGRNSLVILGAFLVFVIVFVVILEFLIGAGDRVTIGVKANGVYRGIVSGARVDLFNMSPEGQPTELIATAYTGDDGIAKFDNIPISGWTYAIATKEGYASSKKNISESDKRSGLIEMYLREKTYASIEVYERAAYTDYTNKPISGVSIKVYLENELLGENYTDSSGRAIIGNLPLYSNVKLKISKDGYEDIERTLYVYQGGRDTAYLTRTITSTGATAPNNNRARDVRIIVRDMNGRIGGARVDVYNSSMARTPFKIIYTNQEGSVDLGEVNNENELIAISKEGYENKTVFLGYYLRYSSEAELENLMIYLEREGLRVVVSTENGSLGGVKAVLFKYVDGYGFKYVKTEYTNPDAVASFGTVAFNYTKPGVKKNVKIEVSEAGYFTDTLYVDRTNQYYANLMRQNLYNETWKFSVGVRECNGGDFNTMHPLGGVRVQLYNRTENYNYTLLQEAYTDSSGEADFGVVSIKAGEVVFSKSGYETDIEDIPYFESRLFNMGGMGVCLNALPV